MLARTVRNGDTAYRHHEKWTSYYRNGTSVKHVAKYLEGSLNGAFVFYDSTTGNKIVEGFFVNNIRHGKWTYYNKNSSAEEGVVNYYNGYR
jgi:antitoxin component YwqK of YwqJK toxin-antitoxin module